MKNSVKTIAFQYSQTIDTLHPDECFSVSYMGRAEIRTEKAEADEGGGDFVSVNIIDIWLGVDVPSQWQPHHFRKVALPDGSPRFKDLISELQTAAIDQFYTPVPLALPDEIEITRKHSDYQNLQEFITGNGPVKGAFHNRPLEGFFCG